MIFWRISDRRSFSSVEEVSVNGGIAPGAKSVSSVLYTEGDSHHASSMIVSL
jgi:hypothetical protein